MHAVYVEVEMEAAPSQADLEQARQFLDESAGGDVAKSES